MPFFWASYPAAMPYFSSISWRGKISRLLAPATRIPRFREGTRGLEGVAAALSIAASLLVVVVSYFLLDPSLTNGSSSANVVEDPNEALEVTLDALSFLDIKLTESQSTITESIKHFDKTNIIKS